MVSFPSKPARLSLKRGTLSSLQRFFETCIAQINTYPVTLEAAQRSACVSIYSDRYFWPILANISTCRKILITISNVKFHGSTLNGFTVVACLQTDIWIDMEILTGAFFSLFRKRQKGSAFIWKNRINERKKMYEYEISFRFRSLFLRYSSAKREVFVQ